MDPIVHDDSGESEVDGCCEKDGGNCQADDVTM